MKSITELRTEEKTLKKGTSALVGLLIVIIVTCVYSTVKNRMEFVLFLPLFFFPMILLNIFKIRKLTKEIKTRK
jgi:hypothetical protein